QAHRYRQLRKLIGPAAKSARMESANRLRRGSPARPQILPRGIAALSRARGRAAFVRAGKPERASPHHGRTRSRMSGFMNPAEFANIRAAEQNFWWYRDMRRILLRMLDPILRGRRVENALEAGCGTGYFSQLVQKERGWPVIALDL